MRAAGGFTLVEVLIVVAIVGILSMIAYPSYQQHVARGNRSAAQQLVQEIAGREVQYFAMARQYTAALDATGLNVRTAGSPANWTCTAPQCSNRHFTVTVTVDNAATPPSFTVTATPTSTGTNRADAALTLDDTGAKTGPWSK